jgi:hypothetical protein
MSSQIARRLVRALADQPDWRFRAAEGPVGVSSTEPAAELCARERQILDLLAQGFRSGSFPGVASPAASAFGCPFARAGRAVAGDNLTTHIFMRIPKFGALSFPGDA